MEIKFIWILPLILQYGSCLDAENCTNAQTVQVSIPSNPTMKFYLFTNNNFYIEQQIIKGRASSITKSNFKSNWPVRIIVHGWKNDLNSCINAKIKDAYLKKGNFNVIVVDWSDWAKQKIYLRIVPYVFNKIGPKLGQFIRFLNRIGNIQFDQIYIIGHDIGAHVAGAAGKYILPIQINTIFGLDPAGAGFQGNAPHRRLDKSHAKYVEQITTNMGEFGYTGLIGHAGFYPNYGRIQNYCMINELYDKFCNHYTSFLYFAETINSKNEFCSRKCSFNLSFIESIYFGFGCPIVKCKPKILMGGEPSIPKLGDFYLITNDTSPFGICNNC